MDLRFDSARPQPQRLCRVELLQSALQGPEAADHRLENLLDRIEVRS